MLAQGSILLWIRVRTMEIWWYIGIIVKFIEENFNKKDEIKYYNHCYDLNASFCMQQKGRDQS